MEPDSPDLPTLETISDWLRETYNSAISIYEYDDHVRITNGSAAHYVNVYLANGTTFTLEGERYGETITKSCDATKEALIETLEQTI